MEFLEDARVGRRSSVMAAIGPLESEGKAEEGEEGGPGPP